MVNSLSQINSLMKLFRYRCPQKNNRHFNLVQFYFLKQLETTVQETLNETDVISTKAKLSGEFKLMCIQDLSFDSSPSLGPTYFNLYPRPLITRYSYEFTASHNMLGQSLKAFLELS